MARFSGTTLMEKSTDAQHEVKMGLKETLIDGDGFTLIGNVALQR